MPRVWPGIGQAHAVSLFMGWLVGPTSLFQQPDNTCFKSEHGRESLATRTTAGAETVGCLPPRSSAEGLVILRHCCLDLMARAEALCLLVAAMAHTLVHLGQ